MTTKESVNCEGMTFYFYDIETSGLDPKVQRIMQFAGQRTDENLNPIGEPHNCLIKITEDVLPDPDSVFVTGITPQMTLTDSYSEAEFLRLFYREISTPDTCMLGYNTLRFDDEFIRYLNYRNFYDPYEWQWKDGRSKWDLMDAVRMTRALRPDGIKWHVTDEGRASNRLELIAQENNLLHEQAHDALSDVNATIAVAKMIREKQPKLFEYLFSIRDKKRVAAMVNLAHPQLLVHTSDKLSGDFLKTSIVYPIAQGKYDTVYVYDLRHDPEQFADLSVEELSRRLFTKKEELGDVPRLPVKGIRLNKCPAIAPLGVLDDASKERLQIDLDVFQKHLKKLQSIPDFAKRVAEAFEYQKPDVVKSDTYQGPIVVSDVDGQLYDGFFNDADKEIARDIVKRGVQEFRDFNPVFSDERLNKLLVLYKARNYPSTLSSAEAEAWHKHCAVRLQTGGERSRVAMYFARLAELAVADDSDSHHEYLLSELQLWGQSLLQDQDEAEA